MTNDVIISSAEVREDWIQFWAQNRKDKWRGKLAVMEGT